jgi:hypothetical protein
MPRYAALIYSITETPEEFAAVMPDYMAFGERAAAAGVMGPSEALQPAETATTVTVTGGKGGKVITTDGPFAETKEVLTGFYLLDCANLDEAISWAAQIPAAWHGKVEVRPCVDFTQMPN